MRITKVNIPKSEINNGLEAIKMDRLGQVVMLAGINGAGKTRLLSLIEEKIKSKPSGQRIKNAERTIIDYETLIKRNIDKISSLKLRMASGEDTDKNPPIVTIGQRQAQVTSWKEDIERSQDIVGYDLIETDEVRDSYGVVPFVPKGLNLKDHNTINKRTIISRAQQIDNVGVGNLEGGTFARIQVIQDRFYNSTHQKSTVSEEIRQKAIDDHDRLKEILKIFLDTELDRNEDGEPVIFNLPLSKANLSNGQKVLIQFCLAIHCQQENLKDLGTLTKPNNFTVV